MPIERRRQTADKVMIFAPRVHLERLPGIRDLLDFDGREGTDGYG